MHELFAHEYLIDFDPCAAYKRVYGDMEDKVAGASGRALLRNPVVWSIIEQGKLERIQKCGLSAEKTIARLQLVYEEAMAVKDYKCAVSALRELGKHFGIYEKHNKQKNYTQDDIDKMKSELEALGFDFRRKALIEDAINTSEN